MAQSHDRLGGGIIGVFYKLPLGGPCTGRRRRATGRILQLAPGASDLADAYTVTTQIGAGGMGGVYRT